MLQSTWQSSSLSSGTIIWAPSMSHVSMASALRGKEQHYSQALLSGDRLFQVPTDALRLSANHLGLAVDLLLALVSEATTAGIGTEKRLVPNTSRVC
mmetsp:Transcript_35897/g.85134  ORF Transcript_35897/g.85134 Transcript_35897/m.85134 type:complete len:97 (-) Transcript_35897:472-762(-)